MLTFYRTITMYKIGISESNLDERNHLFITRYLILEISYKGNTDLGKS